LDLGGSRRERTSIMSEWSSELLPYQLAAIYNDAVSVPLRPLIITGGKVAKDKKYRKGWLDYYNLDEFLKNVTDPTKSKKKQVKYESDSSDSDSDSK
jgi:hypothetical protein